MGRSYICAVDRGGRQQTQHFVLKLEFLNLEECTLKIFI